MKGASQIVQRPRAHQAAEALISAFPRDPCGSIREAMRSWRGSAETCNGG